MKREVLYHLKRDCVLYCYNPAYGLNEFTMIARVLKNDTENEVLTLARANKYGLIPYPTVSWEYDKVVDSGYEWLHPAYAPLMKHYLDLGEQIKKDPEAEFGTNVDQLMDQQYVLEEIWPYEGSGPSFYEEVALFCFRNKIKDVTDIGCCYGFQSEFFVNRSRKPIQYTGVETTNFLGYFYKEDKHSYIHAKYPCDLPHGKLAVSHLCVGFECSGEEVYKTLAEQFEYLAIDNQNERELLEKYFIEVERTMRNPYMKETDESNYVPNMIVFKRK